MIYCNNRINAQGNGAEFVEFHRFSFNKDAGNETCSTGEALPLASLQWETDDFG